MVQVHVPQGVGVRVPPWAPPGFSGSAVFFCVIVISIISAHVAELVDAHGSGPCAARCGGSSPSVGTTLLKQFSALSSSFKVTCLGKTPQPSSEDCGVLLSTAIFPAMVYTRSLHPRRKKACSHFTFPPSAAAIACAPSPQPCRNSTPPPPSKPTSARSRYASTPPPPPPP